MLHSAPDIIDLPVPPARTVTEWKPIIFSGTRPTGLSGTSRRGVGEKCGRTDPCSWKIEQPFSPTRGTGLLRPRDPMNAIPHQANIDLTKPNPRPPAKPLLPPAAASALVWLEGPFVWLVGGMALSLARPGTANRVQGCSSRAEGLHCILAVAVCLCGSRMRPRSDDNLTCGPPLS